jgi:hypothetical protein
MPKRYQIGTGAFQLHLEKNCQIASKDCLVPALINFDYNSSYSTVCIGISLYCILLLSKTIDL